MFPSASSIATVPSSPFLSDRQHVALHLLYEAAEAANKEGLDIWQFAVELGQLRALGLSHTDLRCLLCWQYLEHAQECTASGSSKRLFQPLAALALPKRTCFVLTAKGKEAASDYSGESNGEVAGSAGEPRVVSYPIRESPHWDGKAGQLWWENHLIKEFRRPAVNQESILEALEEEGWPPRIDDPLPPLAGVDSKVRLHDTIKALNRHQLYRILHFGGDGKGRGIQWILLRRC